MTKQIFSIPLYSTFLPIHSVFPIPHSIYSFSIISPSNTHAYRRVNDLFMEESPVVISIKFTPYIRHVAIPIPSLTSPNRPLANLLSPEVFSVESFAKIRTLKWLTNNDVISFYEYLVAIATYQPTIYSFLENRGIIKSLGDGRGMGVAVYRAILFLLRGRSKQSVSTIIQCLNCLTDGNQIYGLSFQIFCNTLSKSWYSIVFYHP